MLKKLLTFLLILVVLFPAYKNLFFKGYFPIHDDIQTMRLHQMNICVMDGQIPCRWVPDMGYGYGYPQFNYYGPLPYYIMELFHLGGVSIIDSVKIGFLLSLLIGAGGMYLLARPLWGVWGGLISTVFYVYAPYKAVNMYVRGAMGELWALAILPFIFWSIREVFKGKKEAIVLLALSIALLLTTHNISAFIFFPFCLLWVLYNYFQNNKQSLKNCALAVIWGVFIAAFFILPVTFERDLVHVDSIIKGYFNYLAHFVGLEQLLLSSYWGYGSSELGDYDDISLSVGVLWWLVPIVVTFLMFFLKKEKFKLTALLISIGLFALFMIHPKSVFIWENFKILEYVQFPWRFLGVSIFAFSLSAGGIATLFENNRKFQIYIFVFFTMLIIFFYSSLFRPQKILNITDFEKFTDVSWVKQQTISIYDYLPRAADKPPARAAILPYEIIQGTLNLEFYRMGSNWGVWKVKVEDEGATVRLPIMYFPNWKVFDNGQETKIDYINREGAITLNLERGEHLVYAKLEDTFIRKFSNFASAIAILFIPVFLNKNRKIYEKA